MANNADERVILETEIDSQGFKKGSAEMQRAVKSLVKTIDGLGPVFEKAVNNDINALKKLGDKSSVLKQQISSIKQQMEEVGKAKLPTTTFTQLSEDIKSAENELRKAQDAETRFKESLKNNTEYQDYENLATRIQQTEQELQRAIDIAAEIQRETGKDSIDSQIAAKEAVGLKQSLENLNVEKKLLEGSPWFERIKSDEQRASQALQDAKTKVEELKAKKEELENSNGAFINGSETAEYKQLAEQLRIAESELRKLSPERALSSFKHLGVVIHSGVVNGLKKAKDSVRGLIKHIGGKLLSNIKKAVAGFAGMRKSAESVRKKVLRMGLALLGMRGIWGGIRQIVSSALNDNEKMQNQLKAIKGVLGQALAPAIQIVSNALGQIITFADKLYTMLTGTSLVAKYNAAQAEKIAKETANAAKSAKEYKRQLAGFDNLNILSDNSSNENNNSSSDSDAALFETQELSGWAQNLISMIKSAWETADFTEVGSTVASKIVSVLTGINWDNYKTKAEKLGKSLATFINGAIGYKDKDGNTLATSIGTTLGEAINTALSFLYTFVTTLDWSKVGNQIAKGFSAFVKTIDWEKAIATAYKSGEGLAALLKHLFTDKDEDGDTVLSNMTKSIAKIVNAIVAFVKGAVDELNKVDKKTGKSGWQELGESISQALIDGITSVDWKSVIATVEGAISGIMDLFRGLFSGLEEIDPETGMTYGEKLWQEIGGQIVAGIIAGMVAALALPFLKGTDAGGGFHQIFQLIYDGLCDAFGIESPAKKMYPVGGYILEGILEGIKEKLSLENLKKWFNENVVPKFEDAIDNIKSFTVDIKAQLATKWSDLKDKWTEFRDKFEDKTVEIKSKIATKWSDLRDDWKTFIGKFEDKVVDIKAKIASKWSDFKTSWNNLKANFTGKTADMKMKIASKWSDFKQKWDNLKKKFTGKTVSLKATFKDAVTGAINAFIDKINVLLGKLRNIGVGSIKPFKDVKNIPHLAQGGIANNRGPGVPAIVGEAGPEAVLPLNKRTLGMLASLIMEQVKNSVFANLTSSIQQALQSVARSKPTVSHIGDSALTASLDGISSSIDSGFSKVASQLQAIANGVNFRIPEAVNLIPYKNKGAGDVQFEQITKMLDMSNEELISVLIQLFNNQTREIVNALKSLKLIVPYDKKQQVQDVIDEINRRIRVTKNNPLLT